MTDFLSFAIQIFEVMVLGMLPLFITIIVFVYVKAILKALKVTMKRSMDEGISELVK